MGMTDQMKRDLAGAKILGFDNVTQPLNRFTRGEAAGPREDVLELEDKAVRTSDTKKIRSGDREMPDPYAGDASVSCPATIPSRQ